MSKIKSKQIDRLFSAFIRIAAFSASGASSVVTSVITTALATAGDGGVAVPLQVATTTANGVVTTGLNRVEIYDATTKLKISDGAGNEIFGRITESGGVYTMTYYSLVSGTETAYTAFSSKSIDFEFTYKFTFDTLPEYFAVAVKERNVSDDASGSIGRGFTEIRTPTGTNTVPDLTYTPDQNYNVMLVVNGQSISSQGSPTPFTISGKTITWSASNAGFALATTDEVVARYTTLN